MVVHSSRLLGINYEMLNPNHIKEKETESSVSDVNRSNITTCIYEDQGLDDENENLEERCGNSLMKD